MCNFVRKYQISARNLLSALDGCAYVASVDHTVIDCGGTDWERFAAENGGDVGVAREAIAGASIWTFIGGGKTQDFYKKCMNRLDCHEQRTLSFLFRCDSPSLRREMRMSISTVCAENRLAGYLFHSQLMSETERPRVTLMDREVMLKTWRAGSKFPILEVCSLCLQVLMKIPAGGDLWCEAEEYYRRGGTDAVRISHGLCPGCALKWQQ